MRATADATVGLVLGVVALALFAVSVLVVAFTPLGLGLVFIGPVVSVTDRWGAAWRRRLGVLLDRDIPAPPTEAQGSLGRRLRTWATDPVRWRNLAHLGFAGSGGWLMAAVPLALLVGAGALAYLFVDLTLSGSGTWARFGIGLVTVAAVGLWWLLTPRLNHARHVAEAAVLGGTRVSQLELRVAEVTRTREASLDLAAAEIRRIERDLHDGPQARLVSLGINLGLARELLETDPQAARNLLDEATRSTAGALADLRGVVRDIRPPVLADRGLVGAVEALALDVALPVTVTAHVPGKVPEPLEAAAWFAVNEALANVVKHSGASHAFVDLAHDSGRLTITVVDDGHGGARQEDGSGIEGVMRRLAAFDGTLTVHSPAGGPTRVRVEVPCELS